MLPFDLLGLISDYLPPQVKVLVLLEHLGVTRELQSKAELRNVSEAAT